MQTALARPATRRSPALRSKRMPERMGVTRVGLLTDPLQVLERLRAGDVLVMGVDGRRLVRAECDVAREAVDALRRGGGAWFGQEGGLVGVRGRLVPVGDVLPGISSQLSQTWRWEGRGRRRVRYPVHEVLTGRVSVQSVRGARRLASATRRLQASHQPSMTARRKR